MIRMAVFCAAETLSILISLVSVISFCVGHACEWIQQQAAAAWFVFCVAMFGVWCGAGCWHVLELRNQRAARIVEVTMRARQSKPSLRALRLRMLVISFTAVVWLLYVQGLPLMVSEELLVWMKTTALVHP